MSNARGWRGASSGGPVVQRSASGAPGKRTLTEMAFPHAATVQSALGAAIPGTAALSPDACAERGVPAFTDGNMTHFASETPALHVAAHEAAHQLQHAGVRDAGLGAEGHAHRVADAVTGGDAAAARGLLASGGDAVSSGVRNYTEVPQTDQVAKNEWKVGSDAKVSETGRTVTTEMMHECYADPALITQAAEVLKAKNSGIEITAGAAGPSGNAPDGSGWKTTVEVVPKIRSSSSGDDYWTDCGRASREVQGPHDSDSPPKGTYTDGGGKTKETSATYEPADMRDEIYVAGGLGADRATAHAAYLALSPADKDAFDKKHGINKYAKPGVGESFVSRRDDSQSMDNFNYHWGAVIMVTEPDRVTFENFAKPGTTYDSKDKKWYFETYGPPTKPGQTFHEKNEGSVGDVGKNNTTIATRTSPDPKEVSGYTTAEILKKYKLAAGAGEKTVLEAEMRKRSLKIHIKVKRAQESEDEVYVMVDAGGKSYESGYRTMRSGDETTWLVGLDKFAPNIGKIRVRVADYDWPDPDDVISILSMDDPWAPNSDTRPWDDAEYHTTISFDR